MKTQPWGIVTLFAILALTVLSFIINYLIRLYGGFYFCNSQLAFNLPLWHPGWEVVIGLILIFLAWQLKQCPVWNLKSLGLVLILTGASQNLIDRLLYGCVMDFLRWPLGPAFNLGDLAITSGILLLFLSYRPLKK